MSNPWVKSRPRDGEIQGFNRTSLSPQKGEKQSEKLSKELFEN